MRAREMYSASIIKEEVLLTKKVLGHRAPALGRQLTRLNKALLGMKRECSGYQVLKDAGHLVSVLNGVFGEMEKYLEKPGGEDGRDTILDFYFSVRHFLNMYERVDEHYRIYTELLPSGEFVIRLYCVNPIENLAQCLSQGKAAVFFLGNASAAPVLPDASVGSGGGLYGLCGVPVSAGAASSAGGDGCDEPVYAAQ